jgi:hypothetical protein
MTVDQHAQAREEFGAALDFIEHHKAVMVRREEQLRVGQFVQIGRTLQIEKEGGRIHAVGNGPRKRGFPYLTGAEYCHSRKGFQRSTHRRLKNPFYHSCIFKP